MKKLMLLLLSFSLGCATHKRPEVWVFRNCAHNGDHQVCECSKFHEEIEAKSGRVVKVCQ